MHLGRVENYLDGFLQSHGLAIDDKHFLVVVVDSLVGVGYIELGAMCHNTFQIITSIESAGQGHVHIIEFAHLSAILGNIDIFAIHIDATGCALIFRECVTSLFQEGLCIDSGCVF